MSAITARPASRLVGLVGQGVSPSLTPAMHELEGRRHGIAYVYRTIDIAAADADAGSMRHLLECARTLGFDGLNVTHPVKQTVLHLLDDLSPTARAVGAVNTVRFVDGRMIGHNTDATGFRAAWGARRGDRTPGPTVLLGAGGAGAAVAHALTEAGVPRLIIVDAAPDRAAALAAKVGAHAASPAELADVLDGAEALVNATPMGMADHPGTPLDTSLLGRGLFVADIVYRPVETPLVRAARAAGCTVMTGLGMAMHQAADAFEIFTSETADRGAMLADLESLVAAEAAGEDAHRAPTKGIDR